MTIMSAMQIFVYFGVLLFLIKPLGGYMACVYQRQYCCMDRIMRPIEHAIYRVCGIDPEQEMNWKTYLSALLLFNLGGFLLLYGILRGQFFLPLNPQGFSNLDPILAFNTAISYITNTNWQAYVGEKVMSHFSQTTGLTVQNFLSAASGMVVLIALIRGFTRQKTSLLGNFWVDVVRTILYILIPLSVLLALLLVSQGVVQNFTAHRTVTLIQPVRDNNILIHEQRLPMGPVASQVAIKQLGSNGGGYYNTNSAHPFENPTPLSNFLELLAILLIPAAFTYTFGLMINDKRQGWSILAVMVLIFIPITINTIFFEQKGNSSIEDLGVVQEPATHHYAGGNMEGKETRFGIVDSAIWASATTATSSGSINAMMDSLMPMGSIGPILFMHFGEIIFGGVGSGLYGMIMMVIVTVFIAGLMVGRTPEYLGKKIESFEMKMASIAILVMPLLVLMATGLALMKPLPLISGPHGFTQVLYAFTSMSNNNGSAFAGLNTQTPFFNVVGALIMLINRYWIMITVLAIAGSLAQKKMIPTTSGTLATHTIIFALLLIGVILVVGALSFFPTLALGPLAEQLLPRGSHGF